MQVDKQKKQENLWQTQAQVVVEGWRNVINSLFSVT
jgi:hypothetical protein